jgi:hypothetical protein
MQQLTKFGSRTVTVAMEAGVFFMGLTSLAAPVFGQSATCTPGEGGIASGAACAQATDTPSDLFSENGLFKKISNILIFLIGAVSVIMLIIGGFRYVLSGGDSNAVESAKNTILYAIIGIIVALLSYAAVSFVISNLNA